VQVERRQFRDGIGLRSQGGGQCGPKGGGDSSGRRAAAVAAAAAAAVAAADCQDWIVTSPDMAHQGL
jgi:3',5'-cyclic AMP phosphodiesterase CpdA